MDIRDGVAKIIKQFPEDEWISEIEKQYPDESIDFVLSVIEIILGGDSVLVDSSEYGPSPETEN